MDYHQVKSQGGELKLLAKNEKFIFIGIKETDVYRIV